MKQALRQWYKKFDNFMLSDNFNRYHFDHCCYFKKLDISYLILLLYVDDILIIGSCMVEILNLKEKLSKEFPMKDLGDV